MKKKVLATGVTALAVVFGATACGDSDTGTNAATSSATSASTTPAAEDAQDHNPADVMFAQMMLPHHAQAIEMSDIILAGNDIPEPVMTLAEQIKAAQGPEIEQLETWLEQWGEPVEMPETGHHMPGMEEGTGAMKGMMSEQDLQALSAAEGAEAARLFLTQMIAHHEGAVEMAETEIEDGRFPDAVQMARDIVATQQQEIDTMNQLLSDL